MPLMIRGEAGRGQDQRRRRARRVRRAGNRDAYVGLFQRRGVIDAVAGHADDQAALLQSLDDGVFMLREDARETIRRLDLRRDIGRDDPLRGVAGEKVRRRQNIRAEAELAGDLSCDRDIVPGHHLDPDAIGFGAADRLL